MPQAPPSPWQQRVSPEHRDAILEVLALQRGLVEINFKLSETQKENADMAKEIEGLSAYIDSLMKRVLSMGSLITSDKSKVGGKKGMFGGSKSVPVKTPPPPAPGRPTARR